MKKFILILIAFLSFSVSSFADEVDCGVCETDWEYMNVYGEFNGTYGDCGFVVSISYRICPGPPS